MKSDGIKETVSRKRDNIIKNAHADDVPREYEEALRRLDHYLSEHKKRNTVERRFVLEMLYRMSAPIDSTTLHELVCEEKGPVSLTTIYNTLDLLVQLKLAKRLDLVSHGMTFFEKTLGMEQHGYVICEQCGNISLLYRPDLLNTLRLSMPRGFAPEDFTLHVHGLCSKCQRYNKRKQTPEKSASKSDVRQKTGKQNK